MDGLQHKRRVSALFLLSLTRTSNEGIVHHTVTEPWRLYMTSSAWWAQSVSRKVTEETATTGGAEVIEQSLVVLLLPSSVLAFN